MTVNIALDSTLCALGLKYILSEYFDINANIIADNSTPEAGDTSSALYIVTPARYCANLDFFIWFSLLTWSSFHVYFARLYVLLL